MLIIQELRIASESCEAIKSLIEDILKLGVMLDETNVVYLNYGDDKVLIPYCIKDDIIRKVGREISKMLDNEMNNLKNIEYHVPDRKKTNEEEHK